MNKNFQDKKKIGEHYETMFRNQQQQQNNQKSPNLFHEKATGIIIIYPSLFLHVIEVIYKYYQNTLKYFLNFNI